MAATRPATREVAAAAVPAAIPSAIASRRARRVARRTAVTIACSSGDTHVLLVGRGLFVGFRARRIHVSSASSASTRIHKPRRSSRSTRSTRGAVTGAAGRLHARSCESGMGSTSACRRSGGPPSALTIARSSSGVTRLDGVAPLTTTRLALEAPATARGRPSGARSSGLPRRRAESRVAQPSRRLCSGGLQIAISRDRRNRIGHPGFGDRPSIGDRGRIDRRVEQHETAAPIRRRCPDTLRAHGGNRCVDNRSRICRADDVNRERVGRGGARLLHACVDVLQRHLLLNDDGPGSVRSAKAFALPTRPPGQARRPPAMLRPAGRPPLCSNRMPMPGGMAARSSALTDPSASGPTITSSRRAGGAFSSHATARGMASATAGVSKVWERNGRRFG